MRPAAAIAIAVALVAATVTSARVASAAPGYDVRIPDKVSLVAGELGAIGVSIAVDRGLVVSRDAAVIVDLDPGEGVVIRKRRLGRADAVDPEADAPRFAISLEAVAPGDRSISVRVRFWLCAARSCRPVDESRRVVLDVAAPAATGSGSGSGSAAPTPSP